MKVAEGSGVGVSVFGMDVAVGAVVAVAGSGVATDGSDPELVLVGSGMDVGFP